MRNIKEHIEQLENKLLHSEVRSNPTLLDDLLAVDFEEIGSSGKISSRADVIDWLTRKEKDATWTLSKFAVRQLTEDVLLATYQATKNQNSSSKGSMRSSIWQRINGNWKMVFHQATKL